MSRELNVFALDVSPLMSQEEAKSVIDLARYMVEDKLAAFPKDEVGLVFAGTAETRNSSHDQFGYGHITVAHEVLPVAAVGMPLLRTLLAPPERKSGADLFSTLILAVDMLAQRLDKLRKNSGDVQRVVLATAGLEPLDAPDEAQLDKVVEMCGAYRIDVSVLTSGIDMATQTCVPSSAEKRATLALFNALRERLGDERITFIDLDAHVRVRAQPRAPPPPPSRAKFTGQLELGDGLKVRVRVFAKVLDKKLPAPKPFSLTARDAEHVENAAADVAEPGAVALADPDPEDGDGAPSASTTTIAQRWAVEKEVGYATAAAPLVNVMPEGTKRAYKFGQDYVPVTNFDAGRFKFLSGSKCLQLVGFVPRDAVPRTHLLGGVDVLTADKGDDELGAETLAALVEAVFDQDCAMLVRFIPRSNAAPRTALCLPCAEDAGEGKIAYYFAMHSLPFADEVRTALWPAADASSLPTAAQLAATAALVDSMMMVAPPSDEGGKPAELLCPDTTPNPYIHHVRRAIRLRALAPGTPLADVDPALAAMLDWDPSIKARSAEAAAEFAARCPTAVLKPGEGGVKRTRTFALTDGADDADAAPKRSAPGDGAELDVPSGPILLGGPQPSSSIGLVDPVADLKRMLDDRVVDLTQPALAQMSAVTLELAANAHDERAHALVLPCVEALRDACLDRLEPAIYNQTLRAVRESTSQAPDGAKLWATICARPELTLISSAELEESEVTPEEAARYFDAPDAPALPPAPAAHEGHVGVLDDLE